MRINNINCYIKIKLYFGVLVCISPAIFVGICLLFDKYLMIKGYSWTPVHYESLFPLVGFIFLGWRRLLLGFVSAIFVVGSAVLYFLFYLSFDNLLNTTEFLLVLLLAFSFAVWLVHFARSYLNSRLSAYVWPVIIFLFLIFGDKFFCSDKLSSSYMPYFLNLYKNNSTVASSNPIYPKLKEHLETGGGAILIVVESLGIPVDPLLTRRVMEDNTDFEFYAIKYEGGSTVPAEIRYLCGYNNPSTVVSSCLPHFYGGLALHGNSLSYFNRYKLYQMMGFNSMEGRAELSHLPLCNYAYNAVCDRNLLAHLYNLVDSDSCRGFYYMLTIDSHFPYSKYKYNARGVIGELEQYIVFARTIKRKFHFCKVFIVGDHPPPIADSFQKDVVQAIEIR
jgi:hypothetical protein